MGCVTVEGFVSMHMHRPHVADVHRCGTVALEERPAKDPLGYPGHEPAQSCLHQTVHDEPREGAAVVVVDAVRGRVHDRTDDLAVLRRRIAARCRLVGHRPQRRWRTVPRSPLTSVTAVPCMLSPAVVGLSIATPLIVTPAALSSTIAPPVTTAEELASLLAPPSIDTPKARPVVVFVPRTSTVQRVAPLPPGATMLHPMPLSTSGSSPLPAPEPPMARQLRKPVVRALSPPMTTREPQPSPRAFRTSESMQSHRLCPSLQ